MVRELLIAGKYIVATYSVEFYQNLRFQKFFLDFKKFFQYKKI